MTSATNPMTTITKSTTCSNFFDLVTPKGKEIGVNLNNGCTVYVQSARGGLPTGKRFGSLGEALEAYRAKDIKAALYALMEN